MNTRIHVTPNDDGDWEVKREKASRASSIHDTQADALEAARRTAQREGGEVVIHGRDGRIRDADSFSNDPHPPKDRKH
jgi:uncharacterized protein YdaT